jgi:hypothetical protein
MGIGGLHELSWGGVREESTVVDDDHLISKFFGLIKVVGGEQNGNAFRSQIGDNTTDQLSSGGVNTSSGLVEERHFRTTNERQCQRKPLLLPT